MRSGCRCIEIDTWDGEDKTPNVTHGNSNFTPVKLISVLKCIRDNAFVTSCYPVIISLENHCDSHQRSVMAVQIQKTFGNLLAIPPENKDGLLPSPNDLIYKILLKGSISGTEDLDKLIYLASSKSPQGAYQMKSYEETSISSEVCAERTISQMVRIYPYGLRFQSSNYYPHAWDKGAQLVALNYQTFDEPMIYNTSKFRDNGACGYLLKPRSLLGKSPSLNQKNLIMTLIAGRISMSGSPYISMKILKHTEIITKLEPTKIETSFNHQMTLTNITILLSPDEESSIEIIVDLKSKEERYYAAYPIKCLRTGYRVIPLYQEGIEQQGCYLLAHIQYCTN